MGRIGGRGKDAGWQVVLIRRWILTRTIWYQIFTLKYTVLLIVVGFMGVLKSIRFVSATIFVEVNIKSSELCITKVSRA